MEITVLGQRLEVVEPPIENGLFVPDYDAFYEELHEKSSSVVTGVITWKLSSHYDLGDRRLIMVRLARKSFTTFGLEFTIDNKEAKYAANNAGYLDSKIIRYLKEYPDIQQQITDYITKMNISDIGVSNMDASQIAVGTPFQTSQEKETKD